MIETKNIRNLYAENMDDDLDKIISLDFLKNNYISGGSTLGGTQYLFVSGSGTPEENAVELQAAYDEAKNMPRYLGDLSDVQFYTKYFYKGQTFKLIGSYYKVIEDCETSPDELVTSDSSIGTTEEQAESNKTIILVAPGEYDFGASAFVVDSPGIDIVSLTGNPDVVLSSTEVGSVGHIGVRIYTNNVFLKGINTKKQQFDIISGDNYSNIKCENCLGGEDSFSVGAVISGTFINCTGGNYSFGGKAGTASGTFENCTGGVGSFGGYGIASGIFINCTGGSNSFGGDIGTASGTFNHCKGGEASFGGYGTASGIFKNCIGGNDSFGGGGVISDEARLYYCKLISGTFTTPNPGGKLVLCIDGDNNVVTTDDSTIPISPISTSVFEKSLAQNDTYDWGADLTIDEKDDVYFISLNPEVATVNQNGVVTAISEESINFAEILAVGKSSRESLLVVNNADFGIFKFNFGGGDFMAGFYETCHLVKPNGDIVALTTGVAEACPSGVCHLIYEKTNTSINLAGMPIIGELKTLFGGDLYCIGCTSLTTLSAPSATHLECSECTSLTSVSAPNATILVCSGCTSLTSVSAPNATILVCSDCALTANAIASLLAELVATGEINGMLDISGGTNANYTSWSGQAHSDKEHLETRGWTITYNDL